jgi:hypothetical protein
MIKAIREALGIDPPILQNLISITKDPNCKDPMCGPKGIRKDLRMGKLMGGGPCYCHCVITDTVEKRHANKVRKLFGMELLK